MSLSETLKLRVNCHSEKRSAFWDSVVSHHCVTVNVTTSEGENIQPIDSVLATRFLVASARRLQFNGLFIQK